MIKKELGKTFQHAGIYSLGVILSRGISFLMLPIYTRFLSPADYGVLELLEMTVEVISIITGMGILQGMAKFYYQYDEEKDRKELVSTIFILIVSGYSLTCLFGGLFSSNISRLVFSSTEYTYLIMVSFLNLFLQITVFTSLTFIRVQQKSWLFVTVNAVKLIIQLFLNILFVVYFKMGVIGILYS
nr:oligosaccharide flippase family protein [Candidatus Dadabacteria bacterium]